MCSSARSDVARDYAPRLNEASDGRGEHDRAYRGWRVVGACFVLAAFAWGFGFYGQTVYIAEFSGRRGWPIAPVAAGTTLFYLATAFFMTRIDAIVLAIGLRRALFLGIGIMVLGLALLAQVQSLWQLYAVYIVIAYGWASMGVVMITTFVGQWFSARRGLALSMAFNGASVGGVVVAPATIAIAYTYGFSIAMACAIVLMVTLLVPIVVLYARPRAAPSAAVVSPNTGASNSVALSRDPRFWGVAAPFAIAFIGQVGFIAHMVSILTPTLGQQSAGYALGAMSLAGIAGRLVLGALIDRLDPRRFAAWSMLTHIIALTVIAFTTTPWLLFVMCIVFGFSLSNLVILPSLVVQRTFEPRLFARAVGQVTAVGVVTYAFGPGLVGLLRYLTGGYTVPLLACAGCYIVAASVLFVGAGSSHTTRL